jgi:ABC-type uncharacterized transport system permease subunit
MSPGPLYVAAHVGVALLYFAIAWRTLRRLRAGLRDGFVVFALPVAVLAHAALLASTVLYTEQFRFGFAAALSATFCLTAFILWAEDFAVPMRGLYPLVLPLAGVAALLPAAFHGVPIGADTTALRVHLLVAILAYSLLTIAAMHALLMAALDRQLHAGVPAEGGTWARLFEHVPPLLAMERLLFRLIGIGFALLTLTLISGIFFSEQLFGRALRFDHKTVFAIASWLVFAGLLVGRLVFGWRGRTALRWTFAGFVMLLLAYVGSRFVAEVILGRVS